MKYIPHAWMTDTSLNSSGEVVALLSLNTASQSWAESLYYLASLYIVQLNLWNTRSRSVSCLWGLMVGDLRGSWPFFSHLTLVLLNEGRGVVTVWLRCLPLNTGVMNSSPKWGHESWPWFLIWHQYWLVPGSGLESDLSKLS